ncbi:hypothetical protein GCM10009737_02210 [Nocardioides lentus]|uniref:Sulfotransferase family protein n=1 Tax=Nocardioides lentus TaxID=338077 RepID=A0ABN2NX64_9ACTN
MALPHRGFVWLSMPKCASTAVEEVLEPHARVILRGEFKHTNYTAFTQRIEPVLAGGGHRRESYEVVCLFREPVGWLESWWRYRSRPELKEGPKAHNYTGDMSFTEFVDRYVERHPSLLGIGRPARFCSLQAERVGVDRVLRYESTDVWQGWLTEKVGQDLGFRQTNVSAKRPAELDPGVRRRAVDFFGPEYDIWAHLEPDGQWAPPADHLLSL